MVICSRCGKKPVQVSFSRHQKGSSGHGGAWNLKAPIVKHTQTPNLHLFKGQKYCTKCVRIVKKSFNEAMSKPQAAVVAV